MELDACEIIASSNVPNKATIETATDKHTQSPPQKGIEVEGIQS